MADHLLSGQLLESLLQAAQDPESSFVAADFRGRDAAFADEATKLALDRGGRVVAIGKNVRPWHALDTGAFYCRPQVWEALDDVPRGSELSVLFGEVARRGHLRAADVSGAFWYDIDTAEDLAAASVLLAGGTV